MSKLHNLKIQYLSIILSTYSTKLDDNSKCNSFFFFLLNKIIKFIETDQICSLSLISQQFLKSNMSQFIGNEPHTYIESAINYST